ncbi:UTP11L [Bugula neritina]|uniref:U3 small nucleolar RNA-associated protein 11 n=1 Tax=Bugula neritina TaxID=10212 RepID=A0A7J7K2T1_BUGNE|nr:UTP11L [Bugula neritina]KAF6040335.1 UTP11L [Bugula neritina]
MSSFKNAMKSVQKSHKERSQPSFRSDLGHLEKKRDYKVRANDRAKKEKALKKLRLKAAERNPNEFTRKMIVTKLKDGVHQCRELKGVTDPDQIKLIQSQDKRYVEYRRVLEAKKAQRLKDNLHLIQDGQRATHTFFVDNKKEAREFNLAERLNTHPALLDRAYNRLTNEQLSEMDLASTMPDPRLLAEAMVAKEEAYKELGRRERREKQLQVAREKLEVKNHLMEKKAKKVLVKKETKNRAAVYKWESRRKR